MLTIQVWKWKDSNMKVKIPFKPRFKVPMLLGEKTLTSRTRKMGESGDTFEAFGATFEITDVFKADLDTVAYFFDREGCSSREDFIEVWEKIHPRKGFIPTQRVYVHVFKVGGALT